MRTKKIFILVIIATYVITADATIIKVPENYNEIQTAINASASGDTIAVSPGTYFENINFRGKNVVLTSLYYLASDTSYITSTIINGSNPIHPDTASCVIFNSGEDTTSVIQGFTITAGAGTKWTDIHGAGIYREGGGILVELSSPSILHNRIVYNLVTNTSGVTSTGGGGMRIGDGNPIVSNNLVIFNEARYGAGIVLNYAGSTITNNIIASNTGGQDFHGGSGIWIAGNLGTVPKTIVNNTITNNNSSLSSGTGGISVWSATNVHIKNNIIWNNIPELQIKKISSTPQVSYSDVQGGYTGEGNLDKSPVFDVLNYLLSDDSPCIDSGDTLAIYNDIEDTGLPGSAMFPSKGLLRNDMGAYGGPFAALLPVVETITGADHIPIQVAISAYPNPFYTQTILQANKSLINATLFIYNMTGQQLKQINHISGQTFTLNRDDLQEGIYILRLTEENEVLATTRLAIIDN